MRLYEPKKMDDGTYGWQSAFVDALAHDYVLPSFVWDALSKWGLKERDGISLFKKYKSRQHAIHALESSVALMRNFVDNCQIGETILG